MTFPDMTRTSPKPLCLCPHLISNPKNATTFTFYPPLHEVPSIQSINQMPVEILREIFAKFVEVDDSPNMCSARAPASPGPPGSPRWCGAADPTTLGQVCSYWRCVTLSTPSLWSTISIIPDTDNLQAQINCTNMFLARAGTSPLDLTLKDCQYRSDHSSTSPCPHTCAIRTFLSLFLTRRQYWRKIDFHLPLSVIDMIFHAVNTWKPPKCDNLRSASVLVSNATCSQLPADEPPHLAPSGFLINGNWMNPFLTYIWKLMLTPATLRELTWWPGFEKILSDTSVTVFKQITHLNIPYPVSVDELLRVLACFPNTEEVVVSDLRVPSSSSEYGHDFRSPLVLASLRTLRLVASVNIRPVFDALRCPALRTLSLDYFGKEKSSSDDALSLYNFLQGSECRTKQLIIHRGCHKADHWVEMDADLKTVCTYLNPFHSG